MCLSSHKQILCQWDKRKHPVHVKMNVNWHYQSEMLCSLSSKASFVFFVSVCVCVRACESVCLIACWACLYMLPGHIPCGLLELL